MTDFTDSWSSSPPKFTRKLDEDGDPVEAEGIEGRVPGWATASVRYGAAAGVDPRLVMAIIFEEGADTPQAFRPGYDYGRWLHNFVTDKPHGNSLGLGNMKEMTFNSVKTAYPAEFEGDEWSDFMANDTLAIKATAYNLRRLRNELSPRVPDKMKSKYSLNEVLAAGYNAEDYFARKHDGYLVRGELGNHVSAYVLRSMSSFHRAGDVLRTMYTWEDKVDPGMPNHNPVINPNDPDTHIVDIPPFGGYPESDSLGPIYEPLGGPTVPGIGRIQIPHSVDLVRDFAAGLENVAPWANVAGIGPAGWVNGLNNLIGSGGRGPAKRGAVAFADGGGVKGAGSSVGDKIPAWLSDGEFVMNARSTSVNRPFLQALNADPYFLQKMLVTRARSGRSSGGTANVRNLSSGSPATVNISMSSSEDIIPRLKVLALQWDLAN